MHQIIKKHTLRPFCRGAMVLGLWVCASVIAHAQAGYIDDATRQRARAYEPLIITTAQQYNLDPRLLWVIAYLESRFRPWAVSPKGARGLMQLMPATAARWGVRDPYEPGQSIMGAARYVQYLGQRFDGRVDLTLAAYNAGETAVAAYRAGRAVRVGNKLINPFGLRTDGVLPYRETRVYVRTGIALLQCYSADHPTTVLPKQSIARSVQSLDSEIILPAPTIRKSISYAADEIFSASPAPTTRAPRSISYQNR